MRRASSVFLFGLLLASLASSAGAQRCACCAPNAAPVVQSADWCCPGGDASRCASSATKPSPASAWTAIGEAPRPAILVELGISPPASLALLELQSLEGKPWGREGLALRSILRL
jgi:hypothetical protein